MTGAGAGFLAGQCHPASPAAVDETGLPGNQAWAGTTKTQTHVMVALAR